MLSPVQTVESTIFPAADVRCQDPVLVTMRNEEIYGSHDDPPN